MCELFSHDINEIKTPNKSYLIHRSASNTVGAASCYASTIVVRNNRAEEVAANAGRIDVTHRPRYLSPVARFSLSLAQRRHRRRGGNVIVCALALCAC